MTETTGGGQRELTDTQKSLIEQLTENTGRHLLDSGSAYGRNWERNQNRDFRAEQATTLSVRYGYLEITHNVFHWLDERVDYQPDLDAVFKAWADGEDRQDKPYLADAEEFAEVILRGKGIYGDGDPVVINTYNGEDLLSQTLQFVYFTLEDDVYLRVAKDGADVWKTSDEDKADVTWPSGEYVLLQIHGGCDVRGGYTRARVYTTSIEEYSILDNARASLWCDAPVDDSPTLPGLEKAYVEPHRWYTDDANHWYSDGGCDLDPDNDTIEAVDSADDLPTDEAELRAKFWIIKDENRFQCYCGGTITAATY